MFLTSQSSNFLPFGKRILVQLAFRQKYNPQLVSPDGISLNESLITKEIFNVCKVLALSPQSELSSYLEEGDFVCLQDEWLESEPDFSKGFSPSTGEPKVFRPLGKLLPYFFSLDKKEAGKELLFLLPDSCIAGKLFNIKEDDFN